MTHRNTREGVLVDPRAFLHSAAPSSPLWALVDSFDAVTNGMTNPDAAERLAEIEEEAFLPWKSLVAALRAFYADDAAALIDALDRIPDKSPPAALKPLFRAWAATPETEMGSALSAASAAVAALYERVLTDSHPAEGLAEQAEEALRQGMLEHFENDACRVVRELHDAGRVDGPLLALRYAARCVALLSEEGADDAAFFSALIRTVGRSDGFAALALALVDRDEQAAAAAFRGALSGSQRGFAAGAMAPVLAAAAEILEERGRSADKKKAGSAPKRRAAPIGQLDLFQGDAAV